MPDDPQPDDTTGDDLLDEALAPVMHALGRGFAEFWKLPRARQNLEEFLGCRAVFIVGRNGLELVPVGREETT